MIGDRVSRSLSMWAIAAVIATIPCAVSASEQVGQVVRTSVQVSGQSGALAKGDAIHRNERIRSNASGTGAFIFEDGTKLAVGPNSTIVIDEFVYRGGAKIEKLVIGASRGTMRWISGKSDSSAYQITTPSGALSVRGTAFDVYIGPDGVTAVTLLNGGAEFCTAQRCERLTRRCDFLLARPDGSITRPKGVVRDLGLNRRADDVFPFLTGKAGLPRGFKSNSGCAGLGVNAPGLGGSNTGRERTNNFQPSRPDRGPNEGGGNNDNDNEGGYNTDGYRD
jgi:hypothetical protein